MAAKPIKPIQVTHVIFDLDGVIIESESIYEKIAVDIAQEYGKEYPMEVKQQVMGTTEFMTANIICNELDLPITVEEFMEKYEKKVKEYLRSPDLLPGVDELIRHLHAENIPMAVATSSREDLMLMKTEKYKDLMGLFNHIVCASSNPDVKKGKPAPDIFLVCAKMFADDPCPCHVLVFEDSPNGVKAAFSAGMQVVMIPHPDLPKDNQMRKRADQVISNFSEFSFGKFSLPPMKKVNPKKEETVS